MAVLAASISFVAAICGLRMRALAARPLGKLPAAAVAASVVMLAYLVAIGLLRQELRNFGNQ